MPGIGIGLPWRRSPSWLARWLALDPEALYVDGEGETLASWWQNVVLADVTDSSIVKNGATGWNAGGHSSRGLFSDGSVSFRAGEATTAKCAGLNSGDCSSLDFATIDYAIYMGEDGYASVIENGVAMIGAGVYTAATVWTIDVAANVVTYRKDGGLLYTSLTAPTYPLYFDVSLYHAAASIVAVRLTGGVPHVTAWADLTGHGHHVSQATVYRQPHSVSGGIRGTASLQSALGQVTALPLGAAPYSMVAVKQHMALPGADVSHAAWGTGVPATNGMTQTLQNPGGTGVREHLYHWGVANVQIDASPDLVRRSWILRHDGTTLRVRRAGVDQGPQALAAQVAPASGWTIGAWDAGGTTAMTGIISLVAVFRRSLSSADLDQVSWLIGSRYGIP